MRGFIKALVADEKGQDLIEYAIVMALIGLLAEGTLKGLSNHIGNNFTAVDNTLTNAVV